MCRCNSADQKVSLGKIPLYLHGGKNFDNHLLLKYFPANSKYSLTGIPTSSEKLKSLTYAQYQITDTFSFLPSSLDQLSRSLVTEKQEKRERLNFLAESKICKIEGVISTELYNRSKRKLCFPFKFTSSLDELRSITSLPERKHFVSSLTGKCADEEEYDNVKKIWRKVFFMIMTGFF